jgi:streptogramin lyase
VTWAVGQPVVQDRDGGWWAASGDGVLRYAAAADASQLKGRAPQQIYSVQDGLPNSIVLRVFQDSRGNNWAGTADGVACWNRLNRRWRGFRGAELVPGSGSAAVHAFAEDRSGAVWVGLSPRGLVRFRGSEFEQVPGEAPRGSVNSLLADDEGRVWVGSSQGGLERIDNPSRVPLQIERYGLEQGLSSEHVFGVAEDARGRIYVAGGRGVDRLDLQTGLIRHFTSSSGLPSGDTQFLLRDRQGSVWFGSFYGLSRYWPEPDADAETPSPLLRALRVGDRPYPLSELGEAMVSGVELPPGRSSLEVEFGALHFDVREGMRYQYRLEAQRTTGASPLRTKSCATPDWLPARTVSSFEVSPRPGVSATDGRRWPSASCPFSGGPPRFWGSSYYPPAAARSFSTAIA